MAKNRSVIDAIRTIVWFDFLSQTLSLGDSGLDELYRLELRKLGDARGQSTSDNRMRLYREGLSTPNPDISRGPVPNVLQFFANYVEGSERWFFHPLFNLLDGQVRSAVKVLNQIEEGRPDPPDFFSDAFDDIRKQPTMPSLADRNFPKLPMVLRAEHGVNHEAPMTQIRNEMLRLDLETLKILFYYCDGRLYRRERRAKDEARELCSEISIERLTAAVGLMLEAQLKAVRSPFDPLNKLVAYQLPALLQLPHFERVSEKLNKIIHSAFINSFSVGYSCPEAEIFGYPESWEVWLLQKYR